jgi:hypothetical protein
MFGGAKRRSQKFHPTFKIGLDTRQPNKLLDREFSQRRIKLTILSLLEGPHTKL